MKNKKVSSLLKIIETHIIKNHRLILTCINISSSAGGAVMVYRNSPKIHDILAKVRTELAYIPQDNQKLRKEYMVDAIKQLAPLVGPIIALYGVSWGCAIAAHRSGEHAIAALTTAASLAEETIKEYESFKAEAVREIGPEKVKEIEEKSRFSLEERIEDAYSRNPIEVLPGDCLCYDEWSGQVFSSNPDKLDVSKTEMNNLILKYDEASYDELFNLWGISASGMSTAMGFKSKDLVERGYANWKDVGFELEVTSCRLGDKYGRMPALAVKTNVPPRFL